ncbi:MAG TPA: hypothetical protein DCY03_06560 [Planctomycetaceae bacterium]|nr:hypothetical protein [Planctomycetaceae bacterium]
MNLEDVRAELEEELTWRIEELRFFRNRLADLVTITEKELYSKSLVVMLYAHFEGFWKAAFTIYLSELNRLNLKAGEVAAQIMAASMGDLFQSLNDPNKKNVFFRNTASDDTVLHRFCRQSEFAERLHDVFSTNIDIPIDLILDTESNLKPIVVQKTLFRMGFKHDEFKRDEGTVHELLRRRNDIAHGSARHGVSIQAYNNLESAIIEIMKRVVKFIFDALDNKRFLRTPTTSNP